MDQRNTSIGAGAVTNRPFSDPGVPARLAPFATAGVIAVVLALLPPASPNSSVLAAAAVLLAVLILATLLVPWTRFPGWCQASPVLVSFAFVALLRHADGGATSGFAPLVMMPVLWLAIYGTRTQFRLAVVAMAVTFLGPLLLVGPPQYPVHGWREALVWISIGVLAGSATQTLVNQSRHRTADVAALGVITRALTTGSDPRPKLCGAAQLVIGAAFAIIFEQHVDGTLVATAGTDGLDLGPMRIDPGAEVSATAEAWRTGRRIYIADVVSDPRASTRLVQHTGAGAALFQPVHSRGMQDGRARCRLLRVASRGARGANVPDRAAGSRDRCRDRPSRSRQAARRPVAYRPLTGAANRRSWDEEMDRELARARRTGDPLTVGILDMDHFKAYNDACGHLAGDVLLTELVTAVRAELRTGDVIARWGGEEFAIALPDCDLAQAQAIASRLLKVVPSGQTASIGLTQTLTQDTTRALIERADRALYTAKNAGRNQVKTYQTPPALGLVRAQDG